MSAIGEKKIEIFKSFLFFKFLEFILANTCSLTPQEYKSRSLKVSKAHR